MRQVIVTTTIYPPSEALLKFNAMKDWVLVVVGDQRTPHDAYKDFEGYLHPKTQEAYCPELSNAIGWNCIQRRNVGFVYAWKELQADVIATVDDDNIPMDGWGTNLMIGKPTNCYVYKDQPAFDPCMATDHPNLWHRGFPLELVRARTDFKEWTQGVTVDVQADFWNGDPDIDAVGRMLTNAKNITFSPHDFPFAARAVSPFNSQNTFLSRKVIPYYFMFPGIGRMDDIWAAYHVQAMGFKVIYGKPSVFQRRNKHSVSLDLENELLGYKHNLEIVQEMSAGSKKAVLERLPLYSRLAFELYFTHFQ